MKTLSRFKQITMTILVLSSLNVLANERSNEKGNGGDECERRIEEIRSDLQSWIKRGGGDSLDLSSFNNLRHEDYKAKMLDALKVESTNINERPARVAQTPVSCTSDRVLVNGEEKTCANDIAGSIVCNAQKIQRHFGLGSISLDSS